MPTIKLSLREWREQQGWSRAFLANRINKLCNTQLTPSAFQKMEESGSYPRYDIGCALQKMAKGQIDFNRGQE